MVSNRREDHETSMLGLYPIQKRMVYINPLMIHKVLTQLPLIWENGNPYGRLDLDMNARLAQLSTIWPPVT